MAMDVPASQLSTALAWLFGGPRRARPSGPSASVVDTHRTLTGESLSGGLGADGGDGGGADVPPKSPVRGEDGLVSVAFPGPELSPRSKSSVRSVGEQGVLDGSPRPPSTPAKVTVSSPVTSADKAEEPESPVDSTPSPLNEGRAEFSAEKPVLANLEGTPSPQGLQTSTPEPLPAVEAVEPGVPSTDTEARPTPPPSPGLNDFFELFSKLDSAPAPKVPTSPPLALETVDLAAAGDADLMKSIEDAFISNLNWYKKRTSIRSTSVNSIIATSIELLKECKKSFGSPEAASADGARGADRAASEPKYFQDFQGATSGSKYASISQLSLKRPWKRTAALLPKQDRREFVEWKKTGVKEAYFSRRQTDFKRVVDAALHTLKWTLQLLAFRNLDKEGISLLPTQKATRTFVAMWMLRFETLAIRPKSVSSKDLFRFVMKYLKLERRDTIKEPEGRFFRAAFLEYTHLVSFWESNGSQLFTEDSLVQATESLSSKLGVLDEGSREDVKFLLQFCINSKQQFNDWLEKSYVKKLSSYSANKILEYSAKEISEFLSTQEPVPSNPRLALFNSKMKREGYQLEEKIWDQIVESNERDHGKWFVGAITSTEENDGKVGTALAVISGQNESKIADAQTSVLQVPPWSEEKRVMALAFFPKIQRWGFATNPFELDPRVLGLSDPSVGTKELEHEGERVTLVLRDGDDAEHTNGVV